MMRVENLENTNGRIVPNQFVIYGNDGTINFQSYQTFIAEIKNHKLTLTDDFDYSNTTSRHTKNFIKNFYICNDKAVNKIWKDAKKGKRVFNYSDYR